MAAVRISENFPKWALVKRNSSSLQIYALETASSVRARLLTAAAARVRQFVALPLQRSTRGTTSSRLTTRPALT